MGARRFLWLLSFGSLVASQSATTSSAAVDFTHLPPPPSYSDGDFTNPDTSKAQIFTNGSSMNVTWTTTYSATTLWLIFDGQYNQPTLLTSGTSQTWYQWTVNDAGNNTRPFSFRAVNTDGTDEEQRQGGFYTGQFWIANAPGSGDSATSSSSTSSSSMPIGSTMPVSASAASEASSSPSASPTGSSGGGGSNATAIGAGVGVGVGVGLIVLAALAFWLYRRRDKKKKEAAAAAVAAPDMQNGHPGPDWKQNSYYGSSEMNQGQASPLPRYKSPEPPASELGGYYNVAHEAPTHREPGELPADASGAQFAPRSEA